MEDDNELITIQWLEANGWKVRAYCCSIIFNGITVLWSTLGKTIAISCNKNRIDLPGNFKTRGKLRRLLELLHD